MAVVSGHLRPRRADSVLEAVRVEIEKRRNSIALDEVRGVTFAVKFARGQDRVRVILTTIETETEF